MKRSIYKTICFSSLVISFSLFFLSCQGKPKYELVWAEEFETEGRLDDADWNYEHGFVRKRKLDAAFFYLADKLAGLLVS